MGTSQIMSDEQLGQPVSTGNLQEKRANDTRFKPGQSGNPKGRKKGSKNKLTKAYLTDIYEDYAEHGKGVIKRLREKDPGLYLRLVAQLIPKNLDVSHSGNISIQVVNYEDDDNLESELIEGTVVDANLDDSVTH